MSLLTPAESLAFQSFLDAATFPVDWNMQLDIPHEHMPPAHGSQALTKATRDLMSLDGDNWRYPLGPYPPGDTMATSLQTNPLSLLYSAPQQPPLPSNADQTERATPFSTRPGSSSQLPPLPLYRVIHSPADSKRTRTYDHSSSSSSSRQSPIDSLSSSSSSPNARIVLPSSAKRLPPPDARLSNKRQRPSATSPDLRDEPHLPPQNRAALLSPSQKKANHIQSEQKRRANIRRGYDALCETVPALREACEAEDEQHPADGKTKSRRRNKGKAKSDDGERIDGRAGPRSENVVLSKTIDYLHELLSQREALIQRLHVARSALPAGHPLLRPQPDAPPPLWERQWTGGEDKGNDDDVDDDDD